MLGAGVHKFDEIIEALKKEHDFLENRLNHYKEENDKLNRKFFEKEYIATTKRRYDALLQDLMRGFPISEEENERIKRWKAEHKKVCSCGGCYEYRFVPSPLGDSGYILCSCGAKFVFREIG